MLNYVHSRRRSKKRNEGKLQMMVVLGTMTGFSTGSVKRDDEEERRQECVAMRLRCIALRGARRAHAAPGFRFTIPGRESQLRTRTRTRTLRHSLPLRASSDFLILRYHST